jgi:hypothetical protein
MNGQTRATADLMVLMMATLSGMAVAVLAVLFGLGGHGWTAARLSASAIVLAPMGAVAWCYRDRRGITKLARAVTLVNVLIDVAIVLLTKDGDLHGALEHFAPAVFIWAALWLLWQILAAAAAAPPRSTTAA